MQQQIIHQTFVAEAAQYPQVRKRHKLDWPLIKGPAEPMLAKQLKQENKQERLQAHGKKFTKFFNQNPVFKTNNIRDLAQLVPGE